MCFEGDQLTTGNTPPLCVRWAVMIGRSTIGGQNKNSWVVTADEKCHFIEPKFRT